MNNKSHRKLWNFTETEFLKKLYTIDGLSLSEILSSFPYRTHDSVMLKIKRMKLSHSDKQKQNIWSRTRTGSKNPMYGKPPATKGHTKNDMECLKLGSVKLSNTIRKKVKDGKWGKSGKGNGMYGKQSWSKGLTKNTSDIIAKSAEKMSKTKREIYKNLGPNEKEMLRQKIKNGITSEVKYKMRLAAIKRMDRNGVLGCRNYNPLACEYFEKLNKENGWNLQHAKNGGEIQVRGYFLDAYDKEKNIVVEYDESHHYRPSVIPKDKIRQNEIISHLKCKFYRYDESTNTLAQII